MSAEERLFSDVYIKMIPWILGVEIHHLRGESPNENARPYWKIKVFPVNLHRYPNRSCLYEFVKIGRYGGTNTIILSWGDNYAEMKPNADGSGFKSFLHADFKSAAYPFGISHENHATFEDMIAHAKRFPWK